MVHNSPPLEVLAGERSASLEAAARKRVTGVAGIVALDTWGTRVASHTGPETGIGPGPRDTHNGDLEEAERESKNYQDCHQGTMSALVAAAVGMAAAEQVTAPVVGVVAVAVAVAAGADDGASAGASAWNAGFQKLGEYQ